MKLDNEIEELLNEVNSMPTYSRTRDGKTIDTIDKYRVVELLNRCKEKNNGSKQICLQSGL